MWGGITRSTGRIIAPLGYSYSTSYLRAFQITPITNLNPTITGSPLTYTVTPTLPNGLNLNSTTGVISGTTTVNTTATVYTFTASNSLGTATTTMTIATGPTFTVNSTLDTADAAAGDLICDAGGSVCTLRAAFQESNTQPYPCQVTVPNSTITLTGTQVSATADLTVVGQSQAGTIVSGGNTSRIINSTASYLNLSLMTLQQGNAGATAASEGGALKHSAANSTVLIDQVTFSNNTTASTNDGGGAAFINTPSGTYTITSSTFQSNTGTAAGGGNIGGGALFLAAGTGTISTCTFNANSKTVNGGGGAIHVGPSAGIITINNTSFTNNIGRIQGGAIYDQGSSRLYIYTSYFEANSTDFSSGGAVYINVSSTIFIIENNTFYNNTASTLFGSTGGALYIGSTPIAGSNLIRNNSFQGNTGTSGGAAIYCNLCSWPTVTAINNIVGTNTGSNCGTAIGSLTSLGYNIDRFNTCGFASTGDQINTDPLFAGGGIPAANGGPTKTISLQGTSPALNAGNTTNCPSTDQRGVARSASCDIGAYQH